MKITKRPIRAFLCHSSDDKPTVSKLYERLVKDGVDAWLDKEKLIPGEKWQVEIPKAVKNSDVVIVCLSSKSVTKEGFVQKEIKLALDVADEKPEDTIFIIPIRLEDCNVPERISRFHWVDLYSDNGYEHLLKALQKRAENIGAFIKHESQGALSLSQNENSFANNANMSNKNLTSFLRNLFTLFNVIVGVFACLASIAAIFVVPEFRQITGLDPTITPSFTVAPTSQLTIVLSTDKSAFHPPSSKPAQTQVQTFVFPTAPPPTKTLEANLVFSDNFDSGISNYWEAIGDWMSVNGQPVLVTGVQTTNYPNPFAWGRGGLILSGVSKLDNYAIEFDFYDGLTAILFSYENENNYKIWRIVNNGDEFFTEPGCQLLFVSQGNETIIPQSEVSLVYTSSISNHIRIEIRGKSLVLYINRIPIYNFKGLPKLITGSIGIIGVEGKPVFDDFTIYKLP